MSWFFVQNLTLEGKKVRKWSVFPLKVWISLKWEEMTTEIDNFEYEFNGTLIVLKIYCEDKAK